MNTADQLAALYRSRASVDEVIAALEADLAPPVPVVHSAPWLDIARGEIGVKEIKGGRHHPRVLEYLATCEKLGKWGRERDETAWCSAFVNWCMEQARYEGTDSAMARSWLGWGVELDEWRPGCIVVLSRGPDPRFGHAALYTEHDTENGLPLLLGGNQDDQVKISPYSESRMLSRRWPAVGPPALAV